MDNFDKEEGTQSGIGSSHDMILILFEMHSVKDHCLEISKQPSNAQIQAKSQKSVELEPTVKLFSQNKIFFNSSDKIGKTRIVQVNFGIFRYYEKGITSIRKILFL